MIVTAFRFRLIYILTLVFSIPTLRGIMGYTQADRVRDDYDPYDSINRLSDSTVVVFLGDKNT